MSALLEIEIRVDRNTTKRYTVAINDSKSKNGQNVAVYLPQTEEEQKQKVMKEYCGGGFVFWTNGTVKTAKDCPEWEDK